MLSFVTITRIYDFYSTILWYILYLVYFLYELLKMIMKNKPPFEWIFKYEKQNKQKKTREKYNMHFLKHKKIYFGIVVILIFLNLNVIFSYKNSILYLDKIFSNQYKVVVCDVHAVSSYSIKYPKKMISCILENDNLINISYKGEPLKNGDRIKVKYFDAIEIGEIIWYERDGERRYINAE